MGSSGSEVLLTYGDQRLTTTTEVNSTSGPSSVSAAKNKSGKAKSPNALARRPTDAFKDTLGRWRSRSLFIEYEDPDYPPFFTLAETDDPRGYVSLKAKYLEYADPTEYIFARKVFGAWEPWEKLLASHILRDHIATWRIELQKKIESETLSRVRAIAEDTKHPQQLSAARLVLSHLGKKKANANLKLREDMTETPRYEIPANRKPAITINTTNTAPMPPLRDDWERVFGITADVKDDEHSPPVC